MTQGNNAGAQGAGVGAALGGAEFEGTVLVAGAGVSGLGALELLRAAGVRSAVADDSAERRGQAAQRFGVEALSTADAAGRLGEFSAVVTSPGWRPDSPLLVEAALAGVEVLGDVEACYRLDRAGVFGAPRRWLVVTGTNGKTTTTGMLASIMSCAGAETGLRAMACGNIGVAIGEALVARERVDVLVAELSSFQLHWSSKLRADAGVLLNLAEDHIDWHGSFEAYAEAKAKVLESVVAVAGVDDPDVARLVGLTGRDDIVGFTLARPAEGQVGVVDGRILWRRGGVDVDVASAAGIEPQGVAGVLDALAAAAVAVTQGVAPRHIQAGLERYRVGGHRGAVVHRGRGVEWVDNSKATNPHAANVALAGGAAAGGERSVIWVAGGQLKGAEIDQLVADHAAKFRAVALLGADRQAFQEALRRHAPGVEVFTTDATDPREAMESCVAFAAARALPGDTVILAPAAASLDMFTGMAARGDAFAAAAVKYCT
ncbi:UDP-N-acetylmuramoyl-L-alanine--D-glutamate ligase [Corynebacterium liangguodongii]|uniref:UDP-N-acetylmuramoylalanine--D-glutamate ligase n=1 Tax=Corynebacterium liangguodongii TaxID=2079535 RepID=A0A2S0WEZ7_9CORY|nr:UDP-N-acetylmuramoyl-L-alanine--D-glutamate ligase [Corynebacterium liangguodongii]AWB84355.1 UDP-N-acetylmuramoyl-L-alanine--D-glutamate ligase [Corynebacterium liangguodongii]PWB99845.1 UDP-N-acetylmuramoyl-L-alanine--D-glutamate ligase [Corynebacterium liangguodongii]